MPFPYGGKATYSDLAEKFGWTSVIISPLLLPFTFVLTHLLCYPFFFPRKWAYTTKQHAWYLEGEDVWRQKMYFNKKNEFGCCHGWNCYVDKEGGKFYETIWGLINCLDATIKEDCVIFTPSALTWVVAVIYFEHPTPPITGHRIRFYFGNGGINRYNPFAWASIVLGLTALSLAGARGLPTFKEKYPMRNEAENFPNYEEDPADIRADGSMAYTNPDDKQATNYGSTE